MTNFQEAEKIGRDIVKDIFNTYNIENVVWTKDKYNTFDAIIEDRVAVEVKKRDCSSTKYRTWILEDYKVKKFVQSSYKVFLYINVFDDRVVIWNVKQSLLKNSTFEIMLLPATTVATTVKKRNYNKKKGVYHLNISDSIKNIKL